MILKFRAETPTDFYNALKLIPLNNMVKWYKVKPIKDGHGDITVTIKSKSTFKAFKQILSNVEDGHVMLQTLERKKDYTGVRDFDREA